MRLKKLLKTYDYRLPKNLIAQTPARPRDSARLLIYSKRDKSFQFDIFKNLAKYLPKNLVLVFNQTRVIPARLKLVKETGGKVEMLYLGADAKKRIIRVLANKKLVVGSNLSLSLSSKNHGRDFLRIFKVVGKKDGIYSLKANLSPDALKKIFERYGQTPLPPYLKNSQLNETARRREYQTIFAKAGESVAAPTAALHFTERLMRKIRQRGITIKFLNLDVNLGTFAPLTEENLTAGQLHAETYKINKATARFIKKAKKQGRSVIAVGTTTARALESAFWNPRAAKLNGATKLFIRPPYQFKIIDGMITNFHVPKSSLMMLVASLIGKKQLLGIYEKATSKKFRFFSFGDGMLII